MNKKILLGYLMIAPLTFVMLILGLLGAVYLVAVPFFDWFAVVPLETIITYLISILLFIMAALGVVIIDKEEKKEYKKKYEQE